MYKWGTNPNESCNLPTIKKKLTSHIDHKLRHTSLSIIKDATTSWHTV